MEGVIIVPNDAELATISVLEPLVELEVVTGGRLVTWEGSVTELGGAPNTE